MTISLVSWHRSDRCALLTESGEVVTYGQLHNDVMRLAELLPASELVFLVGNNDRETITAYLACLHAHAVPLLLNRDLSAQSFAQLYQAYKPAYLFLPQSYGATEASWQSKLSLVDYVLYRNAAADTLPLGEELALLLATSGSTGSPKLVRLSYNNLVANAQSIVQYLKIDENERAITTLPFNYSYGLSVINSHLHAGASIALSYRSFFDAAFWQQMKSQQVSSLAGVPYSYDILLKLRFERMVLPALRTLTQAGGKMDSDAISKIAEICHAKGMRFFTMYGQTEATARIAYLAPEDVQAKKGSIGRAIPNGHLWLENSEGQTIELSEQVGELIYSGPNVALGYALCREDLAKGDEWQGVLKTGDLARQDENGCFYIVGRKQRFLKIFGIRISLDAVEDWCVKRGLTAVAYGRDDLLCVCVQSTTQVDLSAYARELSLALSIHPSAVKFSVLDNIPRLPTGKVDYACLNAMI